MSLTLAVLLAIAAFVLGLYWNRQRDVNTEDMTFWPVVVPDEDNSYYPVTLR